MKKTYIAPSITMVKTDTESLLLSMSNTFNGDGMASGTYETGDQLSKKHNQGNLWDENWEEPEEDE